MPKVLADEAVQQKARQEVPENGEHNSLVAHPVNATWPVTTGYCYPAQVNNTRARDLKI